LTEIDQEGVIAADTDPAQEMGDESVEVLCTINEIAEFYRFLLRALIHEIHTTC